MAVVMDHLGLLERFRFFWAFIWTKRRAAALDLSELEARGMRNRVFLDQQLEYLAMFAALNEVVGETRALQITIALMDATAKEALLLCLPDPDEVRRLGDPMEVFRNYFRPAPDVARCAGCNDLEIIEDRPGAFQFNVTWCVWLWLAERMGVPQACIPNCYSDDLAFPEYFASLGIEYRRTGTLAKGQSCCDFRFQAMKDARPGTAT
ncbi:MAG TPA: L-2-amino-thiazoline-4-carboxylic acid hydrolase [Holophagaceae bacterium]|nr:L-2-amino-thiazoline-4-carboxylic acid hydrolase [Holophagaceae bacterium]